MFAKEVTADGTVRSYREPSAPQGALLQQPSQGACTLGRGPWHCSWGAKRETETALNHFPSPCLCFFPPFAPWSLQALCGTAAFQETHENGQAQHGRDLEGRGPAPFMPILIIVTRAAIPSPP